MANIGQGFVKSLENTRTTGKPSIFKIDAVNPQDGVALLYVVIVVHEQQYKTMIEPHLKGSVTLKRDGSFQ